jgi:hypothetical protein
VTRTLVAATEALFSGSCARHATMAKHFTQKLSDKNHRDAEAFNFNGRVMRIVFNKTMLFAIWHFVPVLLEANKRRSDLPERSTAAQMTRPTPYRKRETERS